jgi:hypothetical protein
VHEDAPLPAYVPGRQELHDDDPLRFWYVPGEQGKHPPPGVGPYCPVPHGVHEDAPVLVPAPMPSGHSMQDVDPVTFWNDLTGHAVHDVAVETLENHPTGHAEQVDEPAVDVWPGEHGRQVVELLDGWYVPAEHDVQLVAVAGLAVYFPEGHTVHDAAADAENWPAGHAVEQEVAPGEGW